MKVLNLVHKEESDIKYDIFKFPDGEVQITLSEFSHKEDYINIKWEDEPVKVFLNLED